MFSSMHLVFWFQFLLHHFVCPEQARRGCAKGGKEGFCSSVERAYHGKSTIRRNKNKSRGGHTQRSRTMALGRRERSNGNGVNGIGYFGG